MVGRCVLVFFGTLAKYILALWSPHGSFWQENADMEPSSFVLTSSAMFRDSVIPRILSTRREGPDMTPPFWPIWRMERKRIPPRQCTEVSGKNEDVIGMPKVRSKPFRVPPR